MKIDEDPAVLLLERVRKRLAESTHFPRLDGNPVDEQSDENSDGDRKKEKHYLDHLASIR